jgi:hypothetical protein
MKNWKLTKIKDSIANPSRKQELPFRNQGITTPKHPMNSDFHMSTNLKERYTYLCI